MTSRRRFCQWLIGAASALVVPAAAAPAPPADEGPRPSECRYFIGSLETPYCWSKGDGGWWCWDRDGRVVRANYPPRNTP